MCANPTRQFRLALIHATRVAIAPIEAAASALWPEAELVSILEEGLSADRAEKRVPVTELNARIVELAHYAERLNPDGILYTCSAFGEGIEQAASASELPIHKPNEAMFEAAFAYGDNLAMIYTFSPSVGGMEQEFREAAEQIGSKATLRSIFANGAMDALKNGDADTHNKLVAEAATRLDEFDAILLAHFSTAQAAAAVRDVTHTPVLASPESAIEKMKNCVVQKNVPET